MELGVAQAASSLGVSPRRVQALLNSGRLAGRRIGRTWLVEEEQLARVARRSRPLSAPMAEGLMAVLSGERPELDPRSTARLRRLLAELQQDPDPAARLASWVPCTPEGVRSFSIARDDVLALRADVRVVPTGISDLRSGLAMAHELEARVWVGDLPRLVQDYLLADVGRHNLHLHVSREPGPPGQVSFGQFLVDLSGHSSSRESAAVHRLLHGLDLDAGSDRW